eukprot:CAMPEP_0116875798 /NCGR_PEP_ID=MMETSP0463-20121206/7890_1 /TAXON_ID=181622 /ORGANISM="Strombidinopsis sp, Strain SopsisLIS2011" /LENGTH=35 /DNA_ID= /DNA_START= /DNA_END= /DNA_ORIENTATION=
MPLEEKIRLLLKGTELEELCKTAKIVVEIVNQGKD